MKHTTGDEKCGCQHLIRRHSFIGDIPNQKPKLDEWDVKDHTKDLGKVTHCSTPSQKVTHLILLRDNMLFIHEFNLVFALFL